MASGNTDAEPTVIPRERSESGNLSGLTANNAHCQAGAAEAS